MAEEDVSFWKTFTDDDGKVKSITVPKIKDLYIAIKLQFERLIDRIKFLEDENRKLKDGVWKDEEMQRLKKCSDTATRELHLGFGITEEESKAISVWKAELLKKHGLDGTKIGAIGGCFEYVFYPTSIGVVGKVRSALSRVQEEFTFRELE